MATTQASISYSSSIDDIADLAALISYPTGGTNLPILVVMHGFSQEVADFDASTYKRLAEGTYLDLTSISGTFTPGETITGGTSGATLVVHGYVNGSVTKRIGGADASDTFDVAETITGGSSGATATVSAITSTSVFAVFVEMRGRGAAGGSEDSGGREVQDITDAIDYVLATYAAETDATQIHIIGYSGGGGNVFSSVARFPDTYNSAAAFFGISDYGYDATDGWYNNGASLSQQALLEAWIGGDPTAVLDRYHSRASVLAVTNYTGGYLRIYHDVDDSSVPVVNSTNVVDALDAALMTNYADSVTTGADNPRWLHNLPIQGTPIIMAEPDFMAEISGKSRAAWQVATSGTLQVVGYLDTSRFKVWLSNGDTEFGEVTYNTGTRVFTISVDTGAHTWRLTLKGQTPAALVTSTINGASYTARANASGHVLYTSQTGDTRTGQVGGLSLAGVG